MKKKTLMTILGNLTAFGPFVTDFYLPCLPELTSYFSKPEAVIQTSLTAGMLGLSVGQLLIGPIADKYGRKRPLLWSLVIFVIATVGCMLSTDIHPFLFFRLLQGITGAGGLVISKAIVADTFKADELSGYFAILAAVQGVAPIIALVIGGAAFSLTTWQGAFAVLGVWGICLWMGCRRLDESLPKEKRLQIPVWKSFQCYWSIGHNKGFVIMTLLMGFSSAALMAYISASPFIFQNHFGLIPMEYSVCFAFNAVGLVIGSALIMRMKDMRKAAALSVMGLLLMSLLTSLALCLEWPFGLFEVPLFLMLFSVGMITPVAMTCALNVVAGNKGMASALLGAMPFFLGGVVAPLTGIGNMIYSTVGLIMLCTVVCGGLWVASRRFSY